MLECVDDDDGGIWRLGGFRAHFITLFRPYELPVFGSSGLLEHYTALEYEYWL